MSALEVASFAAAIAALVLAVVAIALSIAFYRMSSQLSQSANDAAKDIGASVEKLEKLFDRLYADTFSMMKDTVSDMRKHVWGQASEQMPDVLEEAEKKADQKIEDLRKRMEQQITQILKGQQITEGKVANIGAKLSNLVDRAIKDSRNVEHQAMEETIRTRILDVILALTQERGMVKAGSLDEKLTPQFPFDMIEREIRRMKDEGVIKWDVDHWGHKTLISLA